MPIRRYGPGKFSTLLDSFLYDIVLNGGEDASASYPDGGGSYALILGGPDLLPAVSDYAHERSDKLTSQEANALRDTAGIILYERSDGIVQSEWYDSKSDLEISWNEIEAETSDEDFE